MTQSELLSLIGAVASSLCMTWLLFGRLASFSGLIGSLIVAYAIFLATYAVLVSIGDDGPTVRDRIITVAVVLDRPRPGRRLTLGWIMFFTLRRGRTAFRHLNFFTQDLSHERAAQPAERSAASSTPWSAPCG